MSFLNCWFGRAGGVAATEWYSEIPDWWGFPTVPGKTRVGDMGVGYRGFAVPWAVFVDEHDLFHLNCNYSVYDEPDDRATMEVARAEEGYFVGLSGCPEAKWSPRGGYSDPFVPLPVLNLRVS